MRFREWVRLTGGYFRGGLAYLQRASRQPDVPVWQPALRSETICRRADLPERFWKATESSRREIESLGFSECSYNGLPRDLNQSFSEGGRVLYVDTRRNTIAQAIHRWAENSPEPIESVSTVFTLGVGDRTVHYTNHQYIFDLPPRQKYVTMPSASPSDLYARLQGDLKHGSEPPRHFSDLEGIYRFFDDAAIEVFHDGVDRGLFVPMSDDDVAAAKAQRAY